MTTTTREADIAVGKDVPTVTITREFDAPAAKVYRAHVDPDLAARWFGPDGITTEIKTWDCRAGGEWRYVATDENGEYGFRGCFHDVKDNETIVQTFSFEGMPDSVCLERLDLEDLGDGRSRLVATSLFQSFEDRDGMVASGMEAGIQDGYRKLDTLLAE